MTASDTETARQRIHILSLYPRDMNIYGDTGNILALSRRAEWQGYEPVIETYNPGDPWPDRVDVVVGGGGQDSGQGVIQDDLLRIGPSLQKLAAEGTPMLVICGLYQLFGHSFHTQTGETIAGVGIIDATTYAGPQRLIGNIHVDSPEFGTLVGYENHSGETVLGPGARPLGTVTLGAGNTAKAGTEGARYENVIGSYLHGSFLPNNPAVADFLIHTAITRRYGAESATPKPFSDPYTAGARAESLGRPR